MFQTSITVAIEASVVNSWTEGVISENTAIAEALGKTAVSNDPISYHRARASSYFKDVESRISKNVWNLTEQFRSEIELTMQVGIKDGKSAQTIASDLKKYLNNPDRLFRRVKDEFGNLHLSKAAEAYKSGRGIYKSSFKNARRLAVTEANRAYEYAAWAQRQRNNGVVGQRVFVSKSNHPIKDICDHLEGLYPKEFKFLKWHPQCHCSCVSVLMDDEEFTNYLKTGNVKSKHTITDLPDSYKNWYNQSKDRLLNAQTKGTLPYFIKENPNFNPQLFKNLKMDEIADKLGRASSNATDTPLFVGFDPFSPVIIKKLSALKTNKDRQKLLQEIVDDDSFEKLNLGLKDGGITVRHPLHKGKGENPSWINTKSMARDINKKGEDVCFLPEYPDKTSADAIVRINKKWSLADFKHSTTTKVGTLKKDLIDGFEQAESVVLKLTNANRSVFEESIEEIKRKGYRIGDMKLINKHGDVLDVSWKEFKLGIYKKKIRGFF